MRIALVALTILAAALTAFATEDCPRWYVKGAVDPADIDGFNVVRWDVTVVAGSPYTFTQVLADKVKHIEGEHPWVLCTLTTTGPTAYTGPCELGLQGDASRGAAQPSFEIKLTNKTNLWRDQDTFKLKKEHTDLTRFRDKMSFKLLRTAPHITSYLSQFVRLYINGTDYGTYTHAEETDKKYLDNRNLPKGNIYKIQDAFNFRLSDLDFIKPTDDPAYNYTNMRKIMTSGGSEKDNHTRLIATIRAVNNASLSTEQLLTQYFDVPELCAFICVEVLLNNVMNVYARNYLMYAPNEDANTVKWAFMPWDFDKGWSYYLQPDIVKQVPIQPKFHEGFGTLWAHPVINRLLLVPKYIALVNVTAARMHADGWNNVNVKAHTDMLRAQIRSGIFDTPDFKTYGSGLGTTDERKVAFEQALDFMNTRMDYHYQRLLDSIWEPRPPYVGLTTFTNGLHLVTWTEFAHPVGCEVEAEILIYRRPQDATAVYRTDQTLPAALLSGAEAPILNITGLESNAGVQIVARDFYTPGATYFMRVIHRALGRTPEIDWSAQLGSQWDDKTYNVSYKGINWFVAPASMPAGPAVTAGTVIDANTITIDGVRYAALDMADPSTPAGACPTLAYRTPPEGWHLAPNDATTVAHMKRFGKTWGSLGFILREGTAVRASDGAVVATGQLKTLVSKDGISYAPAYCTLRILIADQFRYMTPACPLLPQIQAFQAQLEGKVTYDDLPTNPLAAPSGKCAIINETCPALDAPANGAVDTTTTNATALYSCNAGYLLSGTRVRTCDKGAWSGVAPVCEPLPAGTTDGASSTTGGGATTAPATSTTGGDGSVNCGAAVTGEHVAVVYTSTQVSGRAVYSCDTGYSLSGPTSSECGPAGVWVPAPTDAVCIADSPPAPPNTVNKATVEITSGTLQSAVPSLVGVMACVAAYAFISYYSRQ